MTLELPGSHLMSAFAIKAREEILLGEKVNNVLVTGATGGVGSVAVIALKWVTMLQQLQVKTLKQIT